MYQRIYVGIAGGHEYSKNGFYFLIFCRTTNTFRLEISLNTNITAIIKH